MGGFWKEEREIKNQKSKMICNIQHPTLNIQWLHFARGAAINMLGLTTEAQRYRGTAAAAKSSSSSSPQSKTAKFEDEDDDNDRRA